MPYISITMRYNARYMNHKEAQTSMRPNVPIPVRGALRDLASEIRTWRKLRGLTQAQLANRAGINRMTLARLEHGDGGVSVEVLLRVLRGLGLLDTLTGSLNPHESDIGRLRSDERLPERVRPKRLD